MKIQALINLASKVFPIAVIILLGMQAKVAFAQFGEALPPPQERNVVDSHGINLVSGVPGIAGMTVSIGSDESGIKSDPGSERYGSDNFSGTITKLIIRSSPGIGGALPVGTYYKIDSLGHSEYFTL